MPPNNFKNISVTSAIHDKIGEIPEVKSKAITHSHWVRNLVDDVMIKKKFFNEVYAPKLSLISVEEDSILIRDDSAKSTRLAEIKLHNNKFSCSLDDGTTCLHIQYALILPEIGKVIRNIKN